MSSKGKRMLGKKAVALMLAMLMVLGGLPGLLTLGGGKAYAAGTTQEWQEVGTAGFSADQASYTSLYIDNSTPYVAYSDGDNSYKATVMKYDGSNWVPVGSAGFSAGQAFFTSLYVDDGTPYVAYQDSGNSYKATVMKYDGSNWVPVGSAGFSAGTPYYTSLYVDNGTPYVAYQDVGNSYKATVMKYDGSNWVPVGSAGFSAGQAFFTSLYVDNGTPYVAYQDSGHGSKATVMKYDSDSDTWAPVGSAGFSAGAAYYTSLYIDNSTPYVAYTDGDNSYKATVMKYDSDNDTWAPVGSAGFSADEANDTSLYVDNGTPYVAYRGDKTTVMKYDSDSDTWAPVGSAGFSAGSAEFTSLYVDNGTPYVAYKDYGNSNKATVMSFVTVTIPPVLTADATDNDTNHAIDISFTDDGTWGGAITAVKDGTTTLTKDTDYTVNAGTITFNAGVLTQGVHNMTIKATGYASAQVVQEVGQTASDFSGMGTSGNPYQIANAGQLNAVRNYLEAGRYFKLTANIDLSGYQAGEGWLPIGDWNTSTSFKGNMDGNGFKITGLTINRPTSDPVGLIGYAEYGELSNMKLENVNITGGEYVGGLAGEIDYGKVSNSYVTGSVSGGDYVGGLVGYSYRGTISNSYVTGSVIGVDSVGGLVGDHVGTISDSYAAASVSGVNTVGGLVGYHGGGTISDSYAAASVSGTGSYVGGLVGDQGGGTISDSYAAASVIGGDYVGGLVGYQGSGTISDSYAAASVSGTGSYVGGLVGYQGGTISSSFYDMGTTGQSDNGKTTAEMKSKTTYANAGWDFTDTWGIDSLHHNGYPYLRAIQKYVTYDGNGNTGGTAPIDSTTYSQGATVTVADNTGSLERMGYVFAGWNTAADGSGTSYAAANTFNMGTSDVTLYAKWNQPHTVTYDGNEATSGSVPIDSGTYAQSVTVSVYGNTGNLAKNGYVFAGWNTKADGSGTSYAEGESLTMGAADVTLYAQWLSTNATLSGLSVDQGTLAPVFASSGLTYSVNVANSVSSLKVSLTKGDPNQMISVAGAVYSTVTGNVYSYNASNLLVGPNLVQITVTAQDETHNTYNLTVNRISNNADLSGLTLSSGTLTPAFAAGTTDYTASVANSVSSLTVTPTIADANATETVNGAAVTSGAASSPIDLNVGHNTISVVVTAQDGTTTKTYTVTVTRAAAPSSGDGGGGGGAPTPSEPTEPTDQNESDLIVTIDGETQQAIATATTSEQDGQTVLTITVDAAKLIEQLEQVSDKPVVTIPVTTVADKVTAALTGEAVKAMENKNAILDIQTPIGSYKLPASELLIDQLSEQLGAGTNLDNITLHVDIAKSNNQKIELLANAADKGGFTVVIPPVDFTVTAEFGEKTVQVTKFNSFIEREIPLPEGVDASQVTTAVVLNEDGTTRAVPTKIVTRDGKSYVVINSLTNSTYSVVWNPIEFSDVANHWAKDTVNEMGSRMVVGGVGNDMFNPDHDITRAEFAAIIVRGLGLKLENGTSVFSDVEATDWYSSAINTAYSYQLINGFEDGTFQPNDKITREQAMVIIDEAMAITGLKAKLPVQSTDATLRPFADAAKVSTWAESSIADCILSGIVSGRSSTELAPKDNMTRAEVAAIVERLLQKSGLN